MPLVSPPARVLLTGANGFIATWIGQYLLEAGYHVIAAVRSASKGDALVEMYKKDSSLKGTIEYIVIEDITKEGAFDDIVKDVQGIFHTASPVTFDAPDPKDLIEPAVKGTVCILNSALKTGLSIKRIVLLSSLGAVLSIPPEPRVFTEKDWNEQSLKIVEEQGIDAPGIWKYRASKTLAERSAWDFVGKHSNELKDRWDLVVINPSLVYGPQHPHVVLSSPTALAMSPLMIYNGLILGKFHTGPDTTALPHGVVLDWVDVRDVALAIVMAMKDAEDAGGERIIVSYDPFVYQQFLDVMHSLEPAPFPLERMERLPKGNKGTGRDVVHLVTYDKSKMRKIFGSKGLKPRGPKEMISDTLADFAKRGW